MIVFLCRRQRAVPSPFTARAGRPARAFIHIQDTVQCLHLAIENPPELGTQTRVRIINQMTETHRVRDLAALVTERTGASIQNLPNSRREDDENELHVSNATFIDMGLKPPACWMKSQKFYASTRTAVTQARSPVCQPGMKNTGARSTQMEE